MIFPEGAQDAGRKVRNFPEGAQDAPGAHRFLRARARGAGGGGGARGMGVGGDHGLLPVAAGAGALALHRENGGEGGKVPGKFGFFLGGQSDGGFAGKSARIGEEMDSK